MTAALVAVWDAGDASWPNRQPSVRAKWLRDHGLPADDMYRAEFYEGGDHPVVRVFTYHKDDATGRRHLDPGTDKAAVNEPYDHALPELPPRSLL